MPGPRTQPTALKALRNTSKRPLPPNEPSPPPADLTPPTYLTDPEAIGIWHVEAPPLIALGILGTTHVRAFSMLCNLLAGYHKGILKREGYQAMLRLMDSFGMNPSAQTRIHVLKPPTQKSKWAGLVA